MQGGKEQASKAAQTNVAMMARYSQAGIPMLQRALGYATGDLDRMDREGLPSFVQKGYTGARTAALERSAAESSAARRGLRGPTDALAVKAPAFAGSAAAFARENAGIGTTRAMATLSQRNQLLNSLTGQGATSTDLAAGFGSLTNRALRAGLDAGNPAYEGVVGGISAAVPSILELLRKPNALESGGGVQYPGSSTAGFGGMGF